MLTREVAQDLAFFVNDLETMASLKRYAEARIQTLRESVDTIVDMDTLRKTQGAINELRRLVSLREEVLGDLKNAK
jgi:hypothetical protein